MEIHALQLANWGWGCLLLTCSIQLRSACALYAFFSLVPQPNHSSTHSPWVWVLPLTILYHILLGFWFDPNHTNRIWAFGLPLTIPGGTYIEHTIAQDCGAKT